MSRAPSRSHSNGFSMIELVVVVAIMMVLFVATIKTFDALNANRALDTDALRIATELNEAHSLTLSSKYADPFGVHVASSSATLFEGASYNAASATNTVAQLNSLVQISAIHLTGGGSNVIFQRLTGETTQSGTITLSLIGDPSTSKTITVYATGLIETH